MKILVTGSDGLIGRNILPFLAGRFDILPVLEKDWDICDTRTGAEVMERVRPDVLLNLAAVTNVDGCEDDPEPAFRINGKAPGQLADLCRKFNTRMVHFSTDYVFDGSKRVPYTETDGTKPLSAYGESKLLGEKNVLRLGSAATIVRTEWIYGRGGENFITKVLRAARANGHIEVVNDQWGAPTYAKDLGPPLAALIERRCAGIYHVTNSGSCTWHTFASKVFSLLGMDVPCSPVGSDTLKRKAKRPVNSVLDCSRLQAHTDVRMRPWEAALEEYLASPQ